MKLSESLVRSLDKTTAAYEQALPLAEEWLQKTHGVSSEVARKFRLGVVESPRSGHEAYVGRLAIPYLTANGPVSIKFRCMAGHDCKEEHCPKYMGLPGDQDRLFNGRDLLTTAPFLAVCEGELDTITMSGVVGVPAVGISGVSKWKPHWRRALEIFPEVFVVFDGDKPGRNGAREVAKRLGNAVPIDMPDGDDVSSLVMRDGPDAMLERLGLA